MTLIRTSKAGAIKIVTEEHDRLDRKYENEKISTAERKAARDFDLWPFHQSRNYDEWLDYLENTARTIPMINIWYQRKAMADFLSFLEGIGDDDVVEISLNSEACPVLVV